MLSAVTVASLIKFYRPALIHLNDIQFAWFHVSAALCLHLLVGQHSKRMFDIVCKLHYRRDLMIFQVGVGKKHTYILVSIISQMSCKISAYWISAKNPVSYIPTSNDVIDELIPVDRSVGMEWGPVDKRVQVTVMGVERSSGDKADGGEADVWSGLQK